MLFNINAIVEKIVVFVQCSSCQVAGHIFRLGHFSDFSLTFSTIKYDCRIWKNSILLFGLLRDFHSSMLEVSDSTGTMITAAKNNIANIFIR